MRERTLVFLSIEDALPPNETWVLCEVEDSVTGNVILRSACFENGTFWENGSSHAEGLRWSSSMSDGTPICDWKVTHWVKADKRM